MLFGTFARAPLMKAKEAIHRLATDKPYDYVRQAISKH